MRKRAYFTRGDESGSHINVKSRYNPALGILGVDKGAGGEKSQIFTPV